MHIYVQVALGANEIALSRLDTSIRREWKYRHVVFLRLAVKPLTQWGIRLAVRDVVRRHIRSQ